MKIGVLGGTFDPIHVVHLMAGEAARNLLELDVVTFITAGDPYQKAGNPISDKVHRWEITRRGIAGIDYFEADDREVLRNGPSYMVDTLASFPDDEQIFLILGADAAAGLPTWHRWEEVVDRATVAVISRPGVAELRLHLRVPCLHGGHLVAHGREPGVASQLACRMRLVNPGVCPAAST